MGHKCLKGQGLWPTAGTEPELKGLRMEITGNRGDVLDADHGDGGHPGRAAGDLAPEAILARPGGPVDRPDGPCGARGARVLEAVKGFLRGKGGRKRGQHSTGIARAGG